MSGAIQAGIGKVDITCREEGTQCELLSEKTKAHIPRECWDKKIEVDDPLFVRALVLDDGVQKLVLITMDITAVGCRSISQYILNDSADDFMPNLRGRILNELGIPGANVTVSASHTHPPGRLLVDDDAQLDRTMEAILQALQNMTPVTIGVGTGHEEGLTSNRTLMLKNGRDRTTRGCWPPLPDEDIEGLRPIDPEIGVLRIDRPDGTPLAVVYNFACHLLFGDPQGSVTANFVGVASKVIEDTLGHGTTALFLQGAAGDVIDVLFKDFHRPRDVEPLGNMLALSTLEAVRGIDTGNAALKVITETVVFPRA